MKKKTAYISSFVLTALVLMGVVSWSEASPVNTDVVITINDIDVPKSEFQFLLQGNIAETYNYFYQVWGARDHVNFWNTTYGDQTPLDLIRRNTTEDLVDIKVKQLLASDIGLMTGFPFDTLVAWWKQDNLYRKEKKAKGLAVYGPVENTLGTYYKYFYSNLFLKLQRRLKETTFNGAHSDLKSYYDRHKVKLFNYTPMVVVELLEFNYRESIKSFRKSYYKPARDK